MEKAAELGRPYQNFRLSFRTKSACSFDVEYIYGFVWWGVCKQSRWRYSVTEPHTRWRMCYYGNVMTKTMSQYSDDVIYFCCWRCVYWVCYRCILHLQQYSHRLNLFFSSNWRRNRGTLPSIQDHLQNASTFHTLVTSLGVSSSNEKLYKSYRHINTFPVLR